MRAAPPVEYPVARRGLWDLAAAALAGLAVAAPLAWLAWQLEAARMTTVAGAWTMAGLVGVAAAGAGLVAWRRAASAVRRGLRWDGSAWCEVDDAGGTIELQAPVSCIDFGSALLLQARPHAGANLRWYALEHRTVPARWHALRVALGQPVKARPLPAPLSGEEVVS